MPQNHPLEALVTVATGKGESPRHSRSDISDASGRPLLASPQNRTALVTGANSGLGFEAAAQFVEAGFSRVVVACRTLDKAKGARDALVARTGLHTFEPLELDLVDLQMVRKACETLKTAGINLDVLVLNAGILPGSELVRSGDGIEVTSAASLVGHHVLTLRLLRLGLLGPHARIVIAGSEGARGDVPGMKPVDLVAFAREHFGGDLEQAVRCLVTMQPPARHHWSTTYGTTKALVALWAKALAPHLPKGMTVNAVSPGNTPATNAARHAPWFFRAMMKMAGVVGPAMGFAGSVATGARRYQDAAAMGDEVTGEFFASPKGKAAGPLTKQDVPHLSDAASATACWRALNALTGEMVPTPATKEVL